MTSQAPKASDKLTQLQDCFDQLAAQMFISLHHIRTARPSAPIPGQPDYINPPLASTISNHTSADGGGGAEAGPATGSPPPSATTPRHPHNNAAMVQAQAQATLTADMQELSSDLVKRYQQIEFIIQTLPGLNESQAAQEARIQQLNEQLREVDAELSLAAEERERLVERVDGVIARIRRP